MIYVTGDLHGDPARLSDKALRRLKKGDTLLVCGDFGFVWDGSPAELKLRRKIGKQKYITIFVDGTHDNLPMIREFPEEEYAGGTVRRIEGNLLYAERGTILTLEGKKVFFLGGGVSEDMDERLESGTWHSEEMPTAEELAAAEERPDPKRPGGSHHHPSAVRPDAHLPGRRPHRNLAPGGLPGPGGTGDAVRQLVFRTAAQG